MIRVLCLQVIVEEALIGNGRVVALKGAAEHIARRAPVTHPNMPENFLYSIEFITLAGMEGEDEESARYVGDGDEL